MKKIQIVVINTTEGEVGTLEGNTAESIERLIEKTSKPYSFIYSEVMIIQAYSRQEEAKELNKFVAIYKEYDYLLIITNGSEISRNFDELLNPYVKDEKNKVLYMPLVELGWGIDENKKIRTKGFLNSCLWKSYLTENVGILDEKLAYRQIHTTIFGCLIPCSLFETFKFNEDLKYFYQFDFLNKITHEKIEVVGIPKCSIFLVYDYELKEVSQEEKKEEFKLVSQPTFINV